MANENAITKIQLKTKTSDPISYLYVYANKTTLFPTISTSIKCDEGDFLIDIGSWVKVNEEGSTVTLKEKPTNADLYYTYSVREPTSEPPFDSSDIYSWTLRTGSLPVLKGCKLNDITLDQGEPLINTNDRTLILGGRDNTSASTANNLNNIILGASKNEVIPGAGNSINLVHKDSGATRSTHNITIKNAKLTYTPTSQAVEIDANYNLTATQDTLSEAEKDKKATLHLTDSLHDEHSSVSLTTKGAKTVVTDDGAIEVDATHALTVVDNANNGAKVTLSGPNMTDSDVILTDDDDDIVVLQCTGGNNSVTYKATHAMKGPEGGYSSSITATDTIEISGSGASGTLKLPQIAVDEYGHVTAASHEDVTITLPEISDALDSENSSTAASSKAVKALNDNKAPTNHASENSTYGVAAKDMYGHVKIGDNVNVTDGVISIANYAGSSSAGGAATSASKLAITQNVGSTTQPVYFNADTGLPEQCTYALQPASAGNYGLVALTGRGDNLIDSELPLKMTSTGAGYITLSPESVATTLHSGSCITISDTTISHDKPIAVPNDITPTTRTYISGITLDDFGHVTGLSTSTETVIDSKTVKVAKTPTSITNSCYSLLMSSTASAEQDVDKNNPIITYIDNLDLCYDIKTQKLIVGSSTTVDNNIRIATYGQIQAGSFNASSDARLKENFRELCIDKSILDLPIYKFDFINGAKDQVGCKAQDLQEICPEIVSEGSDGYLSIQESKLVYLLLEEVKQLKAEIEKLKRG